MNNPSKVVKAARFAQAAHFGQMRKWALTPTPYIEHPAKVAARVTLLPDVTEDEICAAWLHDVREDCGVNHAVLLELFGPTVASHVHWLTNKSKEPTEVPLTREAKKELDFETFSIAPVRVKLIKCCDRIENLNDALVAVGDANWALRYHEESRELWFRCLATAVGTNTKLADEYWDRMGAIKKKYGLANP